MPKQMTAKSQRERRVLCRHCYTPMEKQLRLFDSGYDWLCLKCNLRWEVPGDELVSTRQVG